AAQLAQALDALHARGVIHRDVKPSNVLLDADGEAVLADFGLARSADSTQLTSDGQIVGSLHYLAPELIEGGPRHRRATSTPSAACSTNASPARHPLASAVPRSSAMPTSWSPPRIRGPGGPSSRPSLR